MIIVAPFLDPSSSSVRKPNDPIKCNDQKFQMQLINLIKCVPRMPTADLKMFLVCKEGLRYLNLIFDGASNFCQVQLNGLKA